MSLHTVITRAQHPTHLTREQRNASMKPLLDFAHVLSLQVAEYRATLVDAEFVDDVSGLEHLHQTVSALERDLAAFVKMGRRLKNHLDQYDRYITRMANQRDAAGES